MAKVLLVEDEPRMAQAVGELLRRDGYAVDVYGDGLSGAQAIRERSYDVMILDVMLPGRSGTSLASMARELGLATPIIMLTAKSTVDDKIVGLDAGADDYVTKPFDARELSARVRAQLRRVAASDGHDVPAMSREPDALMQFDDVEFDPASLTLRCRAMAACDPVTGMASTTDGHDVGHDVVLSRREAALMTVFMENPEQVLSRDQLRAAAWPDDGGSEYNIVEVYCSFLRRKLAFIGSRARIKAVRGIGYALRGGADHAAR
nr:response regulator transcription factor [Bifidobacterium callimiconis]